MKRIQIQIGVVLAFVLTGLQVTADTLALKDGKELPGTFLGSDGKTIQWKSDLGTLTVEKEKVAAIRFGGSALSQAASAAASAPAAPASETKVTLAAGTPLLVKMTGNVSSKSRPGTPFETVLVADLTSEGRVVVKSGTKVIGRVQSASEPRGLRGQPTLDIRLAELVLPGDKVRIATSKYREAGDRGVKQAARGAAAGAAIGGIADGGDGAGKGAAIGAGVGTLRRGNTISIPPGTLLEFQLVQPVTLTVNPR